MKEAKVTMGKPSLLPDKFYRGYHGSVYLANKEGMPIDLETGEEGPYHVDYERISDPKNHVKTLRESAERDLRIADLMSSKISQLERAADEGQMLADSVASGAIDPGEFLNE